MEQLTLCGIFVLHMLLFYAEITFAFVGQQCAFSTNSFQFNVPTKGQLFPKCLFGLFILTKKGKNIVSLFALKVFMDFLGLLVGFL